MPTLTTYKAKKLTPVHDHILVVDMQFKERISKGGLIIPGDDGTNAGIRPRWGRVFAVGPRQIDVKVGEYILVKHGRWTRGIEMEVNGEEVTVRRVDNDDILLISDEKRDDHTLTSVYVPVSNVNRIEGSMHNSDGEVRN